MRAPSALIGLACLAASGCRTQQSFVEPEPGLERMLEQPRVDPFERSTFYDNGMAMRPTPAGVVPVERKLFSPGVATGVDAGRYVERVPIPIDRRLLDSGRERFEIFCATCHGITGSGDSVVAGNMDLRKPPSLHEERIRSLPDGRLYGVVRGGYGLMPAYAAQLSVEERWSVVAYVRALELSQHVAFATLPVEDRMALEKNAQ